MNKINIFSLREEYIKLVNKANKTDSKKRDYALRAKAENVLIDLRKNCKHEYLVCLKSEYGGSYLDDYTDAHPEERICLVCGIQESSFNNKYGESFKRLIGKPFARFEMENYPYVSNSGIPNQVIKPLCYPIQECIDEATKKGYAYTKFSF